MIRRAFVRLRLLPLFVALTVSSQCAAAANIPTDAELQLPLSSILPLESSVLAVNNAGIFRAQLSDKIWHHVALPESMPPAGKLAPDSSPSDVFYFVPGAVIRNRFPDAKDLIAGLYESTDGGESWTLASAQDGITSIFSISSGALFAITSEAYTTAEKSGPYSLLESTDHGRSWRTLLQTQAQLSSIFPDPDHPGQVCVVSFGMSMGNHIWQSDGSGYHWKDNFEFNWWPKHETNEHFFSIFYATTSIAYVLRATLANYFDYPFGIRPEIPSFIILPTKPSFRFASNEPKLVPVSVCFWYPSATATLADQDDKQDLWKVRVVSPSGDRKFTTSPVFDNYYHSQDRPQMAADLRKSGGFQAHIVSLKQPYARTLNLAELADFSQPGTYKVQLCYDSDWLTDIGATGWGGTFLSDVFTVTIYASPSPDFMSHSP